MQTFGSYNLTTETIQLRERAPDRKAFAFQNKDASASILICNRQRFADSEGLELFPGQIFGRDLYAPEDALFARAKTGTASLLLIEDF